MNDIIYPDALPVYTEEPIDLRTSIQQLATSATEAGLELPITSYLDGPGSTLPATKPQNTSKQVLSYVVGEDQAAMKNLRQDIVRSFFEAIEHKNSMIVVFMVESNLVTANTTDMVGRTPLLAAIANGRTRMVDCLMELGADVNGFGKINGSTRTPLQLAASMGQTQQVQFLISWYHADDSIIAPDGETALRLAAANRHREIVDYLPSRRGGGWLRWKTHHAKAIRRSKKALIAIYWFSRCVVFDFPKFLVWTVPIGCIVLPVKTQLKWAWKERHSFGPWCTRKAKALPAAIKKEISLFFEFLKKVPKATWQFFSDTLPREIKRLFLYLLEFGFKRIPAVLKLVGEWLWDGAEKVVAQLRTILERTISLFHSVFAYIVSFFRTITLADIWNGFCDMMRSIFVDFPKKMVFWALQSVKLSKKILEALFGGVGWVIWWIGYGLFWTVMYIPAKIWVVLSSMAGSIGKAWQEIMVWFDPKKMKPQ